MTSEHTYDHDHNDQSIIHVLFEEGSDNPWTLDYKDLSALEAARAVLNYPVTHFESRDKAVEVALMIRDIVKADAVHVEGEEDDIVIPADSEDKASFFQPISDDGSGLAEEAPELVSHEGDGLHHDKT